MPVFLEGDGHKISPLWISLEDYRGSDKRFHVISKDYEVFEYLQELDEELFPEDLWEDNYVGKDFYIEDWVTSNFLEYVLRNTNPHIDVNTSGRLGTFRAAVGYTNYGESTVGSLIQDFNESHDLDNPMFFPYEDSGIDFLSTYYRGIGFNKTLIPQRPGIGVREALIININNKAINDDSEICDFSLLRNHKRPPKKYNPHVFQSLINERRKIQ